MSKGNQGIQSRNKVSVGQKLGSGANRVHVAATNQRLGGKVGDHVTGKGATNYKGETYYFCSKADMEKFKKEPEKYVKKK